MAGFTALDLVFLGLLAVSALLGLLRGLFREAVSLAAWLGGAWAAAHHGHLLAPLLARFLASDGLQLWVARGIIVVVLVFAGAIISRLLAGFVRDLGLGGADRVTGLLFGLARGVLLAGLASIVLGATGFDREPWCRESKLLPYALPVADALREIAEQGLDPSHSPSNIP